MASSYIEGVGAPLADVAAAELDPTVGEAAAWVADNLAAVRGAIDDAHGGPLDLGTVHGWHRTLMAGSGHLPAHLVGVPRDLQGWIGGTSPLDAVLVTAPPGDIAPLLDDLIAFANRTDVDAVTQAAVAHAQFEVIHPYADGNGRVGRVLVAWVLTRRLALVSPPPVSVRIAADPGGYLSGLTLYRLGDVDPWVRWFADIVRTAGETAITLVRAVTDLQDRWRARVAGLRADAGAPARPRPAPAAPGPGRIDGRRRPGRDRARRTLRPRGARRPRGRRALRAAALSPRPAPTAGGSPGS